MDTKRGNIIGLPGILVKWCQLSGIHSYMISFILICVKVESDVHLKYVKIAPPNSVILTKKDLAIFIISVGFDDITMPAMLFGIGTGHAIK